MYVQFAHVHCTCSLSQVFVYWVHLARSFIHSGHFYSTSSSPLLLRGASRRSAQATAGKGLAQDPYVAARAGIEPTILRLKVIVSTKAPPRPTTGFAGLLHAEKTMIAKQITWAKGGRELIKICHRDSVMKRETAVVSCTPWMYTHVETSMGLLWKIDGFVSRCLKNSV